MFEFALTCFFVLATSLRPRYSRHRRWTATDAMDLRLAVRRMLTTDLAVIKQTDFCQYGATPAALTLKLSFEKKMVAVFGTYTHAVALSIGTRFRAHGTDFFDISSFGPPNFWLNHTTHPAQSNYT